jgi:hypothetical protein
MRSSKIGRLSVLGALVLAAATLALPVASRAAHPPKLLRPRVVTGSATHVLASSALLTGVVYPNGAETSYYFQYGPTTAYGTQTPTVSLGNAGGASKVKVGRAVTGLQQGVTYHFRIVASESAPEVRTLLGRDHIFTVKGTALKFSVAKLQSTIYGSAFIVSGSLTGLGSANHKIALGASPFPYLEAFTPIGAPSVTSAAGGFSFRVSNALASTQFRVVTLDLRPVFSPVVTETVAVRVTFNVRSTARKGFVRMFGTVTPAEVGTKVLLQVVKAVRPGGKSETTEKSVTQFTTVVKKGSRTISRFSAVVNVRRAGRYRAFVKIPQGALVSGVSRSIFVSAAPTLHKAKKGKH